MAVNKTFHLSTTLKAQNKLAVCKLYFKNQQAGLPWWSRGLDSVLPIQGAWVQFLVAEPDPTCYRHRFDLWVEKIPWRRKWQPTTAFFPGKFHAIGGAWKATVYGVTKSWTQLSTDTHTQAVGGGKTQDGKQTVRNESNCVTRELC